jgi:hypothetical protein
MINVNQMTSQLARMPDQALQQYAQMHKNDPYIMALAMSESNRRKSMRTGAQMNAPEEPKVVDQAIQGMASPMPEDVGIGQLPAGEMNFAGGGIVAFSDGGDVPRYQDRGLVQGVQPYENSYDRMNRLRNEEAQRNFTTPVSLPEEEPTRLPGESLDAYRSRLRAFKKTGTPNFIMRTPEQLQAGRREDYAAQQQEAVKTSPVALPRALPEPSAAETQMAMNAGAFKPPPAPPAPPPAAPKVAAGPRLPAAPAAAAPAGLTAAAPNLDVSKMMSTALQGAAAAKHPYETELKGIGQERVAAKEAEVTGLEAIQKQFSDIYKGRKERLDTKEAELSKLKDQGMGLALLQAGAAMMTTPGGLGTALGKGVKVGTEQYAAGLDKLRTAKDKLSDARDRLEEIEAQRGELSARELFKARSAVKDTGIGVREDLVKANMQMYGLKREEALKLVEQQVKVGLSQFEQGEATKRSAFEQTEATKRTAVTAGAPLALLRAVAADPKLQAVYGKGPGGQNKIMDEYNDFVKANPQYLANEAAGMQAFLRAKGALSSLSGAGAAGSVSGTPTGKVLQ